MTVLRKIWRFLMTVRFGVALMVVLMLIMMFATQFEASTSTRAMKHFIYGSAWFDAGTYLFVVNLLVNTWRRRPFRFRHAGFLTVHAGVITIVAGGLMTRYLGIDGTMPIPEGQASGAIMLPESDLVVTTSQGTTKYTTHYDIAPWEQAHDDVFAVPGTPYALRIDRYYPTGAVTDTLLEGATGNGPMLQVALGNGQSEPTSGWLAARDPAQSSATIDGVRVRFVESPQLEALKSQWSKDRSTSPSSVGAAMSAGTLQIAWNDGGIESIPVPLKDGGAIPTKRPGYAVHVGQVFRSFAMTDSGLVEAPQGETNPAIRFHLVGPGDHHEEHYSFTAFPEFRMDPPEGKEHLLSHALWSPNPKSFDAAAGAANHLSEIAFEWRDPGTIVTHTNWGDPSDGQPVGVGETRAFAGANVTLRILQAAREGRVSRTVQKISEEVQNPVVHVRLEESTSGGVHHAGLFDGWKAKLRPAPVDPNRAWVFHGTVHEFATPEGPIKIAYESRTIPLNFTIHLDDFIEENYPGVAMAASYESHVKVQPASDGPFDARIYMNHPLKYAGFTFYQASFQRTPEGEITVLSVARDPGMTVSFVGYVILVVGLIVIFFFKSSLRRLDDRMARLRASGGSA